MSEEWPVLGLDVVGCSGCTGDILPAAIGVVGGWLTRDVLRIVHQSLGARASINEWEHFRNISRSGSILLHCNQQTHLWHI